MDKFWRYFLSILVICVVALVAWLNRPPPAKAVQAIRAFEGNPDLHPKLVAEITSRGGTIMTPERGFYVLHQENIPARGQFAQWHVNIVTFEVTLARYRKRSRSNPVWEPIGPGTEEQCKAIAESYARKKYRGFGSMRFKSASSEWVSVYPAWKFSWEKGDSSKWNRVQVTVSPVDGSIVEYNGIRDPVPGEWGYGRDSW